MIEILERLINELNEKMKDEVIENLNTDNIELKALHQGKIEAFNIAGRMLREEQIKLLR